MLWRLNGTRHFIIETIIPLVAMEINPGSDFGWEGWVCSCVLFEIFQPGGRTRKVEKRKMKRTSLVKL